MKGLATYADHEAEAHFSVEVDVLQNGGVSTDYERSQFVERFFELANKSEWQGTQGLIWQEQEKLLEMYSGMSEFAVEARHRVLQRLPLLISCQDFVAYHRLDEGHPGVDKQGAFQKLVQGWKKSWPSHMHDGSDVWLQLHETRTKLLSTPITRSSPDVFRAIIESFFEVNKIGI